VQEGGEKKEQEKDFVEEYSKLIGLLLLSLVLILLFSSPSLLLAKNITTIDTELSHATNDAATVRARLDLGSSEHIRAFPMKIGDWRGMTSDLDTSRVAANLGADVMLMRDYWHAKAQQPVFFLIVQSSNRTSFHPPIVCYPAMGYEIEEEGKVRLAVQNTSWAERLAIPETKLGEAVKGRLNESPYFNGTISVKKLVVAKKKGDLGEVTERKVVLYFYLKEGSFSDNFTMIRVSALAPTDEGGDSYAEALNLTEELMADTFPCMFELRGGEEPVLFILLSYGSVVGKVAVGLLFLVPLLVFFYPRIKRYF